MRYPDDVILSIRERLDYETLFGEFLTLRGRGAERMAFCIFHENRNTPALSVNLEDGLYHCKNPECDARGDVFSFYMRVRSLTFPEAVEELARRAGVMLPTEAPAPHSTTPQTPEQEAALIAAYREHGAPVDAAAHRPLRRSAANAEGEAAVLPIRTIDESVVSACHQRLLATPALLELLQNRRGLNRDTIEHFMLGHDGQRFYIPVRDAEGQCVNIRRYKPEARRSEDKMISWRVGFGEARLFPLPELRADDPIFLMEGEMDCLLARQLGLNAITATGGAGTWRDLWNPLFANRDVVICYDVDDAGRAGAAHIANELCDGAKSVRVVMLPLAEPVGADFTNFIVDHGHTAEDFLGLVLHTNPFVKALATLNGIRAQQEPIMLHLSHASKSEYYNTPVRMPVMVSGKSIAPYLVPREVRAGACGMPGLKMCERCPVAKHGGSVTHRIEFESNDVLNFIDVPDDKLQRAIKQKVGIPSKCGLVKLEVSEAMNVEMVQLIPEIERTDADAPYVTRQAFYMGHGLQSNQSYVVSGITVPEPKKQYATHLIHTAVPAQSNIDAFQLTEDVVTRLQRFAPDRPGVQGLWARLAEVYEELEKYTRIYMRRDLMLAVDLTFHSLISFAFQGDFLTRGWIEALIIGDSRTGKTTVVQRMLEYYGAGEFGSGENTTLAGLVGGLHQVGNSWALQWGRIPLNDRRLFVVDEAANLHPDHIARMSSMRSSGVAEIIKVHTERTNARTRQIWMTNPRSPRPLSTYSQGVLAVKEMVGAPEDIARFDLIVSAASGDVSLAVVNAPRSHEDPERYTAELCHQRVMWAWSRRSEQVVWIEGAVERVLQEATTQGERYRYATEIPLVEPNEQRVKLARLAVATAALFFSASDDGQQVVVRPEHVEFAAQFLETLYRKPSLAFDEYARQARRRYELINQQGVESILTRTASALVSLMEQEQLTQRDLQEILGYNDRDELRAAVTTLREAGFLKRVGSSFYVKTPAAIRYLRTRIAQSDAGAQGSFAALMQEATQGVPPDDPAW